ncbi:hypothetical protein CCH79_00018371 [Gambusia affinis]|uniref:Uncharacterized protein n=1 Tax=Gambusia affinis TaxID=33528 RepID=A0A315V888_GAMAF|nr:hypothetical protein CCH79_00018371 [Gambusia affinis]
MKNQHSGRVQGGSRVGPERGALSHVIFTLEDFVSGSNTSSLRSGAVPSLQQPENLLSRQLRNGSLSSQKTSQAEDATADHDMWNIHLQMHMMKLWIISRSWRPDFRKWISLPHFLTATVPLMTRSDSTPDFHLSVFRISWESISPSASLLVSWTRAQAFGEETCAEASPACCMMNSFRVAVG